MPGDIGVCSAYPSIHGQQSIIMAIARVLEIQRILFEQKTAHQVRTDIKKLAYNCYKVFKKAGLLTR